MKVAILAAVVLGAYALAGPSAAHAQSAPCASGVHKAVLPTWARAGFSDKRPVITHVLGASDRIVAVVFGYPLLSPPGKTRSNKILWVSSAVPAAGRPADPREADGRRAPRRPRRAVARSRAAPGPRSSTCPSAGCWRLALSWSGRTDTLDLRYQ